MHPHVSNLAFSLETLRAQVSEEVNSALDRDFKEISDYLLRLESSLPHLYKEIIPVSPPPVINREIFIDRCYCHRGVPNLCLLEFFIFAKCPQRYEFLKSFPLLHLSLSKEYAWYFKDPPQIKFNLITEPNLKLNDQEEVVRTLHFFDNALKQVRDKKYLNIEFFNYMIANFSNVVNLKKYREILFNQIEELETNFKPLLYLEKNPFTRWREEISQYV